ncbi:hypothetical protein SAMN06297129_2111 [Pseudooceanicola antarcticus]|uniref:YfdX protein n=2 Tax=Pseudooceanicola antarcticus TaxID=1247613 RepID=A0A285ITU2_9RHOB|nr:hypothetical protein [Pseudooceanicola antarcticus]SNY51408.1 hypothetical protein SAMN06297129_2111 [Pseudooceanicola antarcticus]
MRKITQLALTTAMLGLAAPVLMSDISDSAAAYAKSDNANGGNSGDKGNSGGNSGGNGGNSGNNGSANKGGSGADKPLAASLKGLNSLKRNANGIMNSSDPKMASVREYLGAVDSLEEAEDALAAARGAYADSFAELQSSAETLGLSDTPETWVDEIAARSAELEANPVAEGEEGYEAYQQALQDVADAEAALADALADKSVLDSAEAGYTEASAAASDEALKQAIVDAQNATGGDTITLDDVTDEMMEFARRELGL